MQNANIKARIDSTKSLIERDSLFIPGEKEDEIAFLVAKYIKEEDRILPTLNKSSFDIELPKVREHLFEHFNDEKVDRRYKEIILDGKLIKQCTSPGVYVTSFIGPQMPSVMSIPYDIDETSHVFLGHEATHILAVDHNYDEWIYMLLYSDVIPMLYELLEADTKDSETRDKIISWRLAKMLEMYNHAFSDEIESTLKGDDLRYYQIPEKQYFISYYYTILLYSLLSDAPSEVIKEVREVLNQRLTTYKMLNQFDLLNCVNEEAFKIGCSKMLRNK
ncbi:MAG: hypothetical protein J1F35_07135 [Erysipelotrichales bacterium]|nr:hypothetical protein [Erysipelotrichales bacterium]